MYKSLKEYTDDVLTKIHDVFKKYKYKFEKVGNYTSIQKTKYGFAINYVKTVSKYKIVVCYDDSSKEFIAYIDNEKMALNAGDTKKLYTELQSVEKLLGELKNFENALK